MKRDSCILYPEAPDGNESKLYKDLIKEYKLPRPVGNMIYASYISSDAAEKMDAGGFKRNRQQEHNAKDVLSFIDYFGTIQYEVAGLSQTEREIGAVDKDGNRVAYTDAKEALEKADRLNKTSKGLVATVMKHDDIYNIIVAEKTSRTLSYPISVEEMLKAWDVYKQAFNTIGIDIENLPAEVKKTFSAYNSTLAQQLLSLQRLSIGNLWKNDVLILFNMDANSPQVQRLVGAFGSLENAAQAFDEINMGAPGYTEAQKRLLYNAIKKCQEFQGLDLNALNAEVSQITSDVRMGNPNTGILEALKLLDKKYNIEINEIHRINSKIHSLSDAAAEAAVVLHRQIREMERMRGNNEEGAKLKSTLDKLMKELACKKYYQGILNFLGEAAAQKEVMEKLVEDTPQTGTELERAFAAAKAIQDIKAIIEQYYNVVSALADDAIPIDESIDQVDMDNIRNTAKDLKKFYDAKLKAVEDDTEGVVLSLMTNLVGNTTPDGQAMINAVRMAAADSSLTDFLYSIGRSSNVMIAAMGKIIRNAQDDRDELINSLSLRIRKATNKLYKAGYTSEFMYEDDGHIISDIDWNLYKKFRKAVIKSLYAQGLRGFELKQAIEDWEEANTEDRVVNSKDGRTERVPGSAYRKAFPDLAPAQMEYYDTMMQIKGEIGSLLPSYAQHQYLPPQVRREMLDALGKARSVRDVWKAFKNKAENLWTIREDDDNYSTNGIIDGDEYEITEGAFDNTELRQIPIFHVRKLKDSSELLKNFSTGLAALAGTAVNYDAMSSIAQVVEFLGNFAKSQDARGDMPKAEIIESASIRVGKDVTKRASNTNTIAIIEGFISQHIYGQKKKDKGKFGKFWDNVIQYTSFKGLVTNVKGAFNNYLVGEYQMLLEAYSGEFYGFGDYRWAHARLFGDSGVMGEISELLTNNVRSKGVLFREMFDPTDENFSAKSHQKYYKSMFRQLVGHDCSFIGYAAGEYLIHYVNMYAMLHNQKVLLKGKKISLYDAFEVTEAQDGNSELKLREGVTLLDGTPVTQEWLQGMRRKIRYVNQSTHGAMNEEDKGLIHQRLWGRAVMNFRQWMVEHYSRRFRKRHFDASLGMEREGYWYTFYKYMFNEDTKHTWKNDSKLNAMGMFMKDFTFFVLRAQSQWNNLDDMQKYNLKRVHGEMLMYIIMQGLSFCLGEPDEHKRDWWRRWWIYQVRRLLLDTEASMPTLGTVNAGLTILNAPMAGVNTLNSMMYTLQGLTNGDINKEIKSGRHAGENKYWRNVKKNTLPFFKDWEQMQNLDEDEAIFQIFNTSPNGR